MPGCSIYVSIEIAIWKCAIDSFRINFFVFLNLHVSLDSYMMEVWYFEEIAKKSVARLQFVLHVKNIMFPYMKKYVFKLNM